MKLKIYITAFISFCISFVPQNMIGCGPDIDYNDYYTSFFNANLPEKNTYKPFYYSGYSFLYDTEEPITAFDILCDEWANYCGKKVNSKDAALFLTQYSLADLKVFLRQMEHKKTGKVADSIRTNSMAQYFLKGKDNEGLNYILFAKSTEPFVLGDDNYWEPVVRDSLKMAVLIDEGKMLFSKAKKDFYKLKYGYQLVRLAHYSRNFNEAIELYDKLVASNHSASVLQELSLALKAGALYHIGKNIEAGYLFSKAFAGSEVKRISNYTGFVWSVFDSASPRSEYLKLCKNDKEKADLLALFAISSTNPEAETINDIYKIMPQAEVLQTLAVREINKLEEKYYTPLLNRRIGGLQFYYSWGDGEDSSPGKENVNELITTLTNIASNVKVKDRGLFQTGAAYCAVMVQDYKNAGKYLSKAKEMGLSGKVNDQWMLTNILLSINETDKINGSFEEQFLPSLIWLKHKAQENNDESWRKFYRNIMSEILAKRYHEKRDLAKEALVIGNAENILYQDNSYYSLNFVHSNLESSDAVRLYNILTSTGNNSFEKFLVNNNSIKKNEVIEFIGTSYLREHNYLKAIEWLSKLNTVDNFIGKDPFIDLLYDREEYIPGSKVNTSKLSFAKEMLRLKSQTNLSKNEYASSLYKMALGFYNTTYFGYAWELVEYNRSGSIYSRPLKYKNYFEEDYYSCLTAYKYFELAMNASTNKEFKARCLFMMAKCAQKQVVFPLNSDYYNRSYSDYEVALQKANILFEKSNYFDILFKEYGNTKFYKEAFNSCSYLRDFVGSKKKKK